MIKATKPTKPPKLPPLPHGDGSLRWNAERRCVELLHVIDGKRYTERDATRQDVITKRDQRRARLALTDSGTTTLRQAMEAWHVHHAGGNAQSTGTNQRWAMRKWCDTSIERSGRPLGDRAIAEITVADVERLFAQLIATGKLASGAMSKIRTVGNFTWEHARRLGQVDTNVVAASVAPRRRKAKRTADTDTVWLDADEANAMQSYLVARAATADSAVAMMLLVGLTCGLRPGEARALAWSEVDLDARRVRVDFTITRTKDGRGRERTGELKTDGKSDCAHRTIAIPAVTAAALRRHKTSQSEMRLAAGDRWRDDVGLCFTNDDGTLLREGLIQSKIDEFTRDAGTKRITQNSFRHTFASKLLARNVPTTEVAKLLGHIDTVMVERTYGHAMSGSTVHDTSHVFDDEQSDETSEIATVTPIIAESG